MEFHSCRDYNSGSAGLYFHNGYARNVFDPGLGVCGLERYPLLCARSAGVAIPSSAKPQEKNSGLKLGTEVSVKSDFCCCHRSEVERAKAAAVAQREPNSTGYRCGTAQCSAGAGRTQPVAPTSGAGVAQRRVEPFVSTRRADSS